MTATLFLALFTAILGRFLADEVKAWFAWLHKVIRRKAVARLPAEYRDRYDEEWESGLEEIPGELFRFIYSVNLFRASVGICRAARNNAAEIKKATDLSKRLFDVIFSGLVLVTMLPLFVLIAIAIKLDSRGPILYASRRVGKGGRVFRCLKFRTMSVDYVKGTKGDVRISWIGRILRRYCLDELPQLLNVLRGDMSIVGPRPLLVRGAEQFGWGGFEQFDVPPGVTVSWQFQMERDSFLEKYKSLDASYIRHRSIWLDFKMILSTIGMVLRSRHREPFKTKKEGAGETADPNGRELS